jgi:hypothetical protein
MNLQQIIKKPAYLLVSALMEFAEYLLIFILPVIIFDKVRVFWLTIAMFSLLPLARGGAYLLIRKIFKRTDTRFLYLFGFTMIFMMIVIINRQFTVNILPLLIIFWGLGSESVRMSLAGIRKKYFAEFVGAWDYLQKPAQLFAMLLAPIFALSIYLGSGYLDAINLFGFVTAITALLFFFGLNKPEPKDIINESSKFLNFSAIGNINKSIVFVNILAALLWLQLPLQVIINQKNDSAWQFVLPSFILPYFILAIFKNVFKFKIWQLRTNIKYLSMGTVLVLSFMATNVLYLVIVLALLGTICAFILLADRHEQKALMLDAGYIFSVLLGFLLAVIFLVIFVNWLTLQQQLNLLGCGVLLIGLLKYSAKYYKGIKIKI